MAHALTTYFCTCDFNAASFADDSFESNALVLTAIAFPVASRTKDLLIEETIFFRLQGSVVDGFWFLYFTKRPFPNVARRCETDS